MVEEVVYFKHSEKVQSIYDKLISCKHNGFPVVNQHKQVVGLISRNHIIAAIENQYFKTTMAASPAQIQTIMRSEMTTSKSKKSRLIDDVDDSFAGNLRLSGGDRRRPSVFRPDKKY